MSIQLATSFTKGYPWADAFEASLKKHCQPGGEKYPSAVPFTIFSIEHEREGAVWINPPPTRGSMAQHGSFLSRLPDWHNPTVIFTDADMLMQRPFSGGEILALRNVHEKEVWLGQNLWKGQTLADEAALIGPKLPEDWIEQLFPGYEDLEVRNCGVIVARHATYRRLYDMTRALLPALYYCFSGMAAIQWLICYCVQRWLKLCELPRTIHVHGHVDPGPDVTFDAEGNAYVNGTMAVFRHALNLDPLKNWSSAGWMNRKEMNDKREPKTTV